MKLSEYIAKCQAQLFLNGDMEVVSTEGRYIILDEEPQVPKLGIRRKDVADVLVDSYTAPEAYGEHVYCLEQ